MKRQEYVPLNKWVSNRWGFISFISFIYLILSLSCENKKENIEKYSFDNDRPTLYIKNYDVHYFDSAKLRANFYAPLARKFTENDKGSYMEFPKGLTIRKMDKNKIQTSFLHCEYAIYYEKKLLWEAQRNIVAINEEGDTIKTELMFWDQKKKIVYSDKFVQIYKKDRIIKGVGFEANENFNNYKIRKPTGTIYVKK